MILICMLVEKCNYVVPNSRISKCSKCSKSVWISPSSEEIIKMHPDIEIRCCDCSGLDKNKLLDLAEEYIKERITESQLKELESAFIPRVGG